MESPITYSPYQRKQQRKSYYIPLCYAGQISVRKTAKILNMAPVNVWKLKERYKQIGDLAFINGHKYSVPHNKKYTRSFCDRLVSLYNSEWPDAPFATFYEALKNFYNIDINYNSLRLILKQYGIKPPRSWSTKEKQLHKPRKERPCEGELLQLDASTHDWLMNDTYISLHGAIDDATHTVTGLYFCENECRLGYNEVLRQTWIKYGVPEAVYIDRHSSFVKNKRKKNFTLTERLEYSKNEKTHFNDLCKALNIEVILALSPQGKGRIERLWQTLQGKLPYIFRYLHIDTLDKANIFISQWLDDFNSRFSISASSPVYKFTPLPKHFDLNYRLSVKFTCRTNSRGHFLFHDCEFILDAPKKDFRHFELCLSESFGIKAYMSGQWYNVRLAENILQDTISDKMPGVEKSLIARYLLNDLHSDYA